MNSQDFLEKRLDFPMLSKIVHGHQFVYLDSAATALKPNCVIDSMNKFYSHEYGTVHRAIYQTAATSTHHYNEARSVIQSFLNAKFVEEIIFVPSATLGLNLIAQSFAQSFLQPNDVVLVTEIEHHSNIVPWQMVCRQVGACVRYIKVDDHGDLDLDHYLELLTSYKVKIVSLAHVSNVLGTKHPIKQITQMAHQHGAVVCLDAAQSVAHSVIDVQDLDSDFLVFSGHKVYGPNGIGVVYGKKELLMSMQPVWGGGDMIDRVTFEMTTYNDLPLKFEPGTPNIAGVLGLKSAVDYLQSFDRFSLINYEKELLVHLEDGLRSLPKVKIIGKPKLREGLVSFYVEGVHALDLATFLDLKGYALRTGHLCAQTAMERFSRSHVIRASLALYNSLEEVNLFVKDLSFLIKKLS